MFTKKFLGGAAITALGLVLATPVLAQETTSTIRGEVMNDSGAPVTGAEVTITHVPSGTVSQETTQASGQFAIRGLRVGGPYRVEIKSPDYAPQVIDDIFISVGDASRLAIALEPVDNAIVVTATRRGVQILGSGSSQNRDDIQGVVTVTRDIRSLATRDPLVSQNIRTDGGISIAGSNPRTNRITIDGVQAQDSFGLNTGGLPTRRGPVSLDAVQQFTVSATPFDVSNGDFLGGAFDVVLRQGENDFDGSIFSNYLNEGLVGTRIKGKEARAFVTQENYGGTLRGPIIQDTLFFALSYEYYTSADTTTTGPAGGGFTTNITGPTSLGATIVPLTLADISRVTDVFTTPSGYNSTFGVGSIPIAKGIVDEKYTGRLDWNINEDHRLSGTYRYSESGVIQRTNLGTTSAGLDSQWYLTGEEDTTMSLQLNSTWTDRFSTEVRASQRDYLRLQEPPSGQQFADIRICTTGTNLDGATERDPLISCRNGSTAVSVVRFGPDQFRHANKLETTTRDASATATYELGAHALKFGGQWNETEIFNLFVPNSDGTYYFDSIADFRAGRANQLVYRNALTNRPEDAAAAFTYVVTSGVVQDTWDITDDLTLAYGIRYDRYSNDDKPKANVAFRNRYGFSNTETYDGRDIVMPRVSFSYDATENLKISGGIGLFSGGLPDVFLSNSFSNNGVIDNTLTFERTATGITERSGSVNCVTTPTICTDALNVPVNANFGRSIPASVQAALGGTVISPFAETNSIEPDFEIPSDYRASVAFKLGLFDDWNLGLDVVAVRNHKALAFRDLRAQRLFVNGVQARTPDGRIRYDGLSTAQRTSVVGQTVNSANLGSNRDIQAYNPSADDNGFGVTAAVSLSKEWDNGLNLGASYTRQNMEEFSASARFSSTASSLYSGQFASFDPNTATEGTSQEEVEDIFKFDVGFRKQFVGELETRFTMFGSHRTGRPSTFTMNGGFSRNAVFGVNRGAQLAYVPNLSGTYTRTGTTGFVSSDPLISFDAPLMTSTGTALNGNEQFIALQKLLGDFSIPQGGIVERSSYQNVDINLVDLQISQELPAYSRDHRALLTFDIANVGNLLNENWGSVREFPEDFRLFDVACAGADGVSDNDGALTCNRYRISGVNANQARSINTDASRWVVQIGLKYEF